MARNQLYHVSPFYVTERGQYGYPEPKSFHYLKDAMKWAYDFCKRSSHPKVSVTILGPGGISEWGKRRGWVQRDYRNGPIYFEDNEKQKRIMKGGRKTKIPAPFGL